MTFLSICLGYIIAQYIITKFAKRKRPDRFEFLFIMLFIIFMEFVGNAVFLGNKTMELNTFLSIVAGCSVGQIICTKIFKRQWR